MLRGQVDQLWAARVESSEYLRNAERQENEVLVAKVLRLNRLGELRQVRGGIVVLQDEPRVSKSFHE